MKMAHGSFGSQHPIANRIFQLQLVADAAASLSRILREKPGRRQECSIMIIAEEKEDQVKIQSLIASLDCKLREAGYLVEEKTK